MADGVEIIAESIMLGKESITMRKVEKSLFKFSDEVKIKS